MAAADTTGSNASDDGAGEAAAASTADSASSNATADDPGDNREADDAVGDDEQDDDLADELDDDEPDDEDLEGELDDEDLEEDGAGGADLDADLDAEAETGADADDVIDVELDDEVEIAVGPGSDDEEAQPSVEIDTAVRRDDDAESTTTAAESAAIKTVASVRPANRAAAVATSTPEPPPAPLSFFETLQAVWREIIRKASNSTPTLPSRTVTVTIPAGAAVSAPIAFGGTDPDGDELTYSVAAQGVRTGPKYGTVTIDQATGTFTYDPDDETSGGVVTDTFTVTVVDSGSRWQGVLAFLNSSYTRGTTASMTIVVEPANTVPKTVSDSFSVIADSPVIGNVLINDTDPEGDPLTATLIGNPTHGSVNFHHDGSFTYTPDADYVGTDTFSYVATDGTTTSVVTEVHLTVATLPAGKTPSIGVQGLTWWSGLSEEDTDRALDMSRAAGVTSMRIDISWYVVEYNQGTYDFSLIDPLVNKMVAHNISVLGMLYDTPSWLSGSTNPHAAPLTSTSIALFSQFATATAQHYLGRIDTWEIWNEPNIPRFWDAPDPAAYAALLKVVYPAIKSVSNTATVVAGGLSPDGSGVDPLTFVQGMYASGAGGYFDALAMHPYTFPQLPSLAPVEAVHNLMTAYGDGAKQIWLTEVGAPTGTSPWAVSEEEQAQAVAMFVDFARNNPFVGPIYLYSLLDTGTDPADPEGNFGLIRRDFTPKPAWGVWL